MSTQSPKRAVIVVGKGNTQGSPSPASKRSQTSLLSFFSPTAKRAEPSPTNTPDSGVSSPFFKKEQSSASNSSDSSQASNVASGCSNEETKKPVVPQSQPQPPKPSAASMVDDDTRSESFVVSREDAIKMLGFEIPENDLDEEVQNAGEKHAPEPAPVSPVKQEKMRDDDKKSFDDLGQFACELSNQGDTTCVKHETEGQTKSKKFTDNFFNLESRKELHAEAVNENDRYGFLRDIRDSQKRAPTDKGYDPSTLYIDPRYYAKMTNFDQQYWRIKAAHFDTLVFFRKGKFYELYELDADIGQRELGLKIASRQGSMRVAGVPISTLMEWSAKLIAKGYKVARVDEMVPTGKIGSGAILDRQLTRIFTPGTLIEENMIGGADAVYLLAFVEAKADESNGRRFDSYGVCIVDCGTGEFQLGEFSDDKHRTNFETLLVQKHPKEVIVMTEESPLAPSAQSWTLMKAVMMGNCSVMRRKPNSDGFPDPSQTVELLHSEHYFIADKLMHEDESKDWPPTLYDAKTRLPLAFSAFGACVLYLKELKLDRSLLPIRNFRLYEQNNQETSMILDGQTLRNLDVLSNSASGGLEGTLLLTIDHTRTAFGKRLLTQWLCNPLVDVTQIEARLSAVDTLNKDLQEMAELLRSVLDAVPDLQRKVSRINSCAPAAVPHSLFVEVLEAFWKWHDVLTSQLQPGFLRDNCKSTLIKQYVMFTSDNGKHPDMSPIFDRFEKKLNIQATFSSREIRPARETNPEYRDLIHSLKAINDKLSQFLVDTRRKLGSDKIVWGGDDNDDGVAGGGDNEGMVVTPKKKKNSGSVRGIKKKGGEFADADKRLFLEIPEKVVSSRKKSIPDSWVLISENKTRSLYWPDISAEIAPELQDVESRILQYESQLGTEVIEEFCNEYGKWAAVIDCIGTLDCLQSLAAASSLWAYPSCRPELLRDGEPYLELVEMRHPCLCDKIDNFIPNTVKLVSTKRKATGEGEVKCPPVMLLTGPNMGGKSTLLRQVCINTILAQIGCYVPAEKCKLTPVDRIFTRIGANDNIVSGQSTFMVELQETSSVLLHATPSSLVVLDELGRGTSTYDGYAIAYAVLKHVAETVGCRTLFSTHYHMLTREFEGLSDLVSLCHMDCQVLPDSQEILFTYKLLPGLCPNSYGMNVAVGAGLPREVIDRAQQVSAEFSETSALAQRERLLTYLSFIRQIISAVKNQNASSIRTLYSTIPSSCLSSSSASSISSLMN